MTFHVAQPPSLSNAQSPFRVVDEAGREVAWINQFLDQQRVRCVAQATLRSYAHNLLHFLRWWAEAHHTDALREDAVTESTQLEYIRFQAEQWGAAVPEWRMRPVRLNFHRGSRTET
jgi:site-specific recombinase XerD